MKFFRYFIIGFLAILSIAAIIWLWSEHSNLQARVGTLEQISQLHNYKIQLPDSLTVTEKDSLYFIQKDSLMHIIELKTVKEEYYLTQMDIQSNWYIAYVTLLFVLFGLVGIDTFKREITQIESQNRKYQAKNKNHIISLDKRFDKLELDLNRQVGNMFTAVSTISSNSKKHIDALLCAITAMIFYNRLPNPEAVRAIEFNLDLIEDDLGTISGAPQLMREYVDSNIHGNLNEILDMVSQDIDDKAVRERVFEIKTILKAFIARNN